MILGCSPLPSKPVTSGQLQTQSSFRHDIIRSWWLTSFICALSGSGSIALLQESRLLLLYFLLLISSSHTHRTHYGSTTINTGLGSLSLRQCSQACLQGLRSLSPEKVQGMWHCSGRIVHTTDRTSVTEQARARVVVQIMPSAYSESERRPTTKCTRRGELALPESY